MVLDGSPKPELRLSCKGISALLFVTEIGDGTFRIGIGLVSVPGLEVEHLLA